MKTSSLRMVWAEELSNNLKTDYDVNVEIDWFLGWFDITTICPASSDSNPIEIYAWMNQLNLSWPLDTEDLLLFKLTWG